MIDLEKSKKRLSKLLGQVGIADDDAFKEMPDDEDDFLSMDDKESEIDPEDAVSKQKQRLFALLTPKFGKK